MINKNELTHIMIDGETLATTRRAVIPSIALVKFDPLTGETGDTLHVVMDVQEQIDNGYDVSASTLAFWMKQPDAARKYLIGILDQKDPHVVPRSQGMFEVYNFIESTPGAAVWGNGISFDLGLLQEEFKDQVMPYKFWNERDVRTVVDIGYAAGLRHKNELPFEGVEHNPVDDCRHQIKYVHRYYRDIKSALDVSRADSTEIHFTAAEMAEGERVFNEAAFGVSAQAETCNITDAGNETWPRGQEPRKQGRTPTMAKPYGKADSEG